MRAAPVLNMVLACFLAVGWYGCRDKNKDTEDGTSALGTDGLLYGSHFEGPQNSDRVVIFVHGIFGKADDTWRASASAYWPEMLAKDQEFPKADVFVASYPSPYFGNKMNVSEMATLLDAEFKAAHIDQRYKEILFVCHSLGGVIVQKLLLEYREVYPPKTKLIYFYATPMYGAFVANFARVWSKDPLLTDLFAGDGTQFTASLDNDWRSAGFGSIHRYCAYEKQPTPPGVLVVPEESATYLCDPEVSTHAIPEANHISIVKPLGISSYPHVLLREAAQSVWSSPGVSAANSVETKSNASSETSGTANSAEAATPDVPSETRVVKSICELHGEAPIGAPAWNKVETCVIPDPLHLDKDYRQTDFNCCGGGASSAMSATDVPPGIEIRTGGTYYWSVPDIRLSGDQITVKTYCGPGTWFRSGCEVAVNVFGHYKY